ncbi:MAG TPA: SRPBCC family protein [Methylomirabilota bacterium]|nr:SRPBCC family protein [Methylomirabilota bacterium]
MRSRAPERAVRRLVLAGLLIALATGRAAAGDLLALDEDERRRLGAGEIVLRDVRPPGASASASGGTAVALVRAPVERVWGVLTDYPGHPRYYPRVTAAEVLESNGPEVLVRYTIQIGFFTFDFHMRKHADVARRRIDWHLAEDRANGLLRENSGYWLVEPHPQGSVVTYAVATRTLIPGFLTASSQRDSLVETIIGLRRVATGAAAQAAGR